MASIICRTASLSLYQAELKIVCTAILATRPNPGGYRGAYRNYASHGDFVLESECWEYHSRLSIRMTVAAVRCVCAMKVVPRLAKPHRDHIK